MKREYAKPVLGLSALLQAVAAAPSASAPPPDEPTPPDDEVDQGDGTQDL